MALPGNGIFVVQGEMATVVTAMKRSSRWSSTSHHDEYNSLLKSFQQLKEIMNEINDLRMRDPLTFLDPFLKVIRSEETTGPVTSLALAAVNKFLSYGIIDPTHSSVPACVDSIADAVTHARFVGTDQASDGVVLMEILQVLRTLMLSPEGAMLTNETVCEIMLSCFRICFEPRLTELLRRTAKHCLRDMVQLLFMRLPQFADDIQQTFNIKKLKMRAHGIEQNHKNKSNNKIVIDVEQRISNNSPTTPSQHSTFSHNLRVQPLSTTPLTPAGNIVDLQGTISQNHSFNKDLENSDQTTLLTISNESCSQSELSSIAESTQNVTDAVNDFGKDLEVSNSNKIFDENVVNKSLLENDVLENNDENSKLMPCDIPPCHFNSSDVCDLAADNLSEEYINLQGVRFTPQTGEAIIPVLPYGLPCVRELFRFLISLCNPLDKQNTELMTHTGLSLLTVVFEVAADSIGNYSVLLSLVKDDLCKNLFALLNSERLSIFASDLQVCFLLFESLRRHLKFQFEFYLKKLSDIIISDSPKVVYEQKEISLEAIVQLWHIPGLVTELYLNYDCDMYSSNLFEDLTKLLSKNAFPVTAGVYQTHLLSLDALLTIVKAINSNCNDSKSQNKLPEIAVIDIEGVESKDEISGIDNIKKIINIEKTCRQKIIDNAPNFEELNIIKNKKRWLATGTELFNNKPEKGIQFLQEHGILSATLDPLEIAHFLRENPQLDKKMIGEYISKKKNVESRILEVFVSSFDFTDIRIDEALRLYLETFRLPGEAPLIFLVMEHFAEHWHKCNGEPFANTDAAFSLAYAIIMLNMDQHNHNAKRLNIPMTSEDFMKNLRGLNGSADFDADMLLTIFNSIKNEEIVMPAEQVGLVRENYLWKVLLRRGVSPDGVFYHIPHNSYDKELFRLIWGPTISALSFVFDKSSDSSIYEKAIEGFKKCANIVAYYNLTAEFDTLILTLCKFTTLMSLSESSDALHINFGHNLKAQHVTKTVFHLVHSHGDIIREGWKNILDIILHLFKAKLLPKILTEADDFCEASGKVSLIRESTPAPKSDTGLFSSIYSYIALSSDTANQRIPTQEEQEYIKIAKSCIKECCLEQLIIDSKFLQSESLHGLIQGLIASSKGPDGHKSLGMPYNEDASVFFFELSIKVLIQNRDRITALWSYARDHLYMLIMSASSCDYPYLLSRAVTGLLRLASCLMRNEEMAPMILDSLRMLLLLKPTLLFRISKQISAGLFELLKTSAQNIHTESDWDIIFTLLECVGAGAIPPKIGNDQNWERGAKSDGALSSEEDNCVSDRGYTSDSELSKNSLKQSSDLSKQLYEENWSFVSKDQITTSDVISSNSMNIELDVRLLPHSPEALVKCWECLAFIVRDVAHITPYNFQSCIRCIRTFVEATLHGSIRKKFKSTNKDSRRKKTNLRKRENVKSNKKISSGEESDSDDLPEGYQFIAIQLLDLMHTLHTRTAHIFRWWAEEGADPPVISLWVHGWKPLLQGISRLCCDNRIEVRSSAINYLHRALLMHDLQMLTANEWENCFNVVLFPLLGELLCPTQSQILSKIDMEESRIRASTIMSKVFLHHLTPLLTLNTFSNLWLTILEFMDRYMTSGSDLLYEAILESLKNMLLVMHSVKAFTSPQGYSELWTITWERINKFLPNLKEEIFKEENKSKHVHKQELSTNKTVDKDIPNHQVDKLQNSDNECIQNSVISSPLLLSFPQVSISTPISFSEQPSSNCNRLLNNECNKLMTESTECAYSKSPILNSTTNVIYNPSSTENVQNFNSDVSTMPVTSELNCVKKVSQQNEIQSYLLNVVGSNYSDNTVICQTKPVDSIQNYTLKAENINNVYVEVKNETNNQDMLNMSDVNLSNNLIPVNSQASSILSSQLSNYFSEGIMIPPGTEFFYSANNKPSP